MSFFDSNDRDVFDSRTMLAYIRDQEADAANVYGPLDEDERAEIQEEVDELKEFLDEAEGYAGETAERGITFIADSYFITYAKDYADDIGTISSDADWPANHIDWDAAAKDLQQDFTESEHLDGCTYWYR